MGRSSPPLTYLTLGLRQHTNTFQKFSNVRFQPFMPATYRTKSADAGKCKEKELVVPAVRRAACPASGRCAQSGRWVAAAWSAAAVTSAPVAYHRLQLSA